MDSKMDLPHNRPMVPPKPDKDKISLPTSPPTPNTESGCVSDALSKSPFFDSTSPNPARKTSINGQNTSENESPRRPSAPPKPNSNHTPPPTTPATSKPALPPKPSNNSCPRLSFTSSPPTSLTPPTTSSPSSCKISPPLLPKGRNSISIANAILANKNSAGNKPEPTNFDDVTPRRHPIRSPSAPLSPRPNTANFPAAPRPYSSIFSFPHPPEQQNLNQWNANSSPLSLSTRAKTVSLGRNVAPPTSPTGNSVTQFFTNKAATLARMLPLDLNFGSKSSPPNNNINKSTTKSSISSHLSGNMTHNNNGNNNMPSSQFGRFHNNVSFASNGPIPPPPPPRLRRKLSPVSSLSPVEDSPNSPNTPSVFSPQTTPPPSLIAPLAEAEEPVVIYAEIDKEKKWAARRLKSNGDLFPNNKDVTTISVEKVESGQLKEEDVEEEGIQGSLVITINRDIDPKVVSVKSVIVNSPSELIPEVPQKSKEGEETVASQIQFFEQSSSQAGSGSGDKELVKRESEVACVKTSSVAPPKRQISAEAAVVDSWLGKYLKDPIFVEKSSSQKVKPCSVGHDSLNSESTSSYPPNSDNLIPLNSSTETTRINLNKNEHDNLPEDEDSGNKSFLFSRLSTVGGCGGGGEAVRSNSPLNNNREKTNDNSPTLSSMTMSNPTTKPIKKSPPKDHEDVTTTATTTKSETACPTTNDQDSLIQSVDSKIQSVVHRLSNLSGKVSPSSNQSESPPPPIPKIAEEREFESLNITESGESCEQICNKLLLSPLRKETFHSDIAISSTSNDNDVTTTPTTSSESREGSSSIVRRRSWNCSGDSSSPCESSSSSLTNLRDKHNRKVSGLGWVDEGDSTGVLGDVDTSDAPVPNSSSTEEIGSSFSLRRKKWGIFSSFGKPSSSSTSSSSNNGTPTKGGGKNKGKDKSRSLMSDMNGKIVKNISRQISGPILISPPQQDSPQDSKLLPREKSQSHSAVQFSPDVVDITSHQNNRHRYSEGSIGEENTLLPRPESEPGDDSSICSFSSVSTTGTGYTITMSPGYDSILAELSQSEKKAFYVAREILTSEQTFIDVLDLLTVDFPNAIRRYEDTLKHPVIPPQDLDVILGGLPNLKRVNEELQVDLQQRISNWIEHPKLADVIVKKGPFLKLYAHYIKNFEKITLKLDECCSANVQFARAVQEFELSDRCHKLGLKHYMLKPVQRMPQYRLLLEDYLKQLEPEGCDYEDTVKALAIVKDVADHANEAIKLQVNADKLLHLQNRMTGATLMKADRLLIKEGELVKVCRKDLQPRFFALMNDCLMCMSYNATAGSTKDLKMRNEMPLAGMKVCLSASEDYQNEFSVISTARSFNLVAKTGREREEWMKALNDAIHDNIRKRSCRTPDQEEGFALGKIAPVWIQDSRVTMCQICTAEFTVTFRRHHCRSCGKVVCRHCSGNQAPLQYLKNDAERVCDECYQYLLEEFDKDAGSNEGLETSRETIRTRFKKVTPNVSKRAQTKRNVKSRLEVPANNSGSRISSYLHWRERKAWKRRWFVLMDRVLYIYAASEDIVAIKGIPVLGWNVDVEKSEFMDGGDNEAVFKLSHLGQNTLLFQADNPTLAERWVNLMKEATVLT